MAKLFATALALVMGLGAFAANPTTASAAQKNLVLELKQSGETKKVVIKLRPDLAPKHVARIEKLAGEGFYDGIVFHRVIPGFMAQSGDPTGTGRGGSKYPDLPAEFTSTTFERGTVGAARTQNPNSANSQFFICFGDGCSHLSGQYTVWGQVVSGMDAVDNIKAGSGRGGTVSNPDKIEKAYIEQASS